MIQYLFFICDHIVFYSILSFYMTSLSWCAFPKLYSVLCDKNNFFMSSGSKNYNAIITRFIFRRICNRFSWQNFHRMAMVFWMNSEFYLAKKKKEMLVHYNFTSACDDDIAFNDKYMVNTSRAASEKHGNYFSLTL